MDWRDIGFWASEADKAEVRKEMAMLRTVRLAMHADGDMFVKIYDALAGCISAGEGTNAAEVEGNWAALKEIGRR